MATNQVKLQGVFDNLQDAPQAQAYIDKRVDAAVYLATDNEIADAFGASVTKVNMTANNKRAFLLMKINKTMRDMVRKAAADAQEAANIAATLAAQNSAEP